jgi:anti-anti-sigma factor
MTPTLDLEESTVIRFEGRMDTAKCAQIEAETKERVTRPVTSVVFDLKDVEFISSAFLRLCIYAHKQAGEEGFQIINVDPSIKRVFKIAGLDMMLRNDSPRE